MIYLGIDPGKDGGISYIQVAEGKTKAHSFVYSDYMLNLLCSTLRGDIVCCLEQVHAMPKQGVTSMFNFGVEFGYIKGVLEASKIPYQEVSPQKWKKEFSLNGEKEKSIEACKRLFPDVCLLRTEKCRKEHDGMAESLLMAEYARRNFK